jgi:hypothetical protein
MTMNAPEHRGLFTEASNTQARLKMGVLGFAGSGKTFTSTEVAIGLVHYMREKGLPEGDRPAYFLDTETGSDWVQPRFAKAGVKLRTAKSRAFKDLVAAVREAEAQGSVLIIDSISHFWREFTEAYMKRKNRSRLEFADWNYLKPEWGKFTDAFVNSNLHIIMAGRAGFEYDYFTDNDGKKQLEKTGIKMKAETELGYEPSLLVLMERDMDLESKQVYRVANVLKDRSDLLDGKAFKNPTYKDFLPHIEYLNVGGVQMGVDLSRTSEDMIDGNEGPGKSTWKYEQEQREIALEKVEALFAEHGLSGQSKEGKAKIVGLLKKHFETTSWKELGTYPLATVKKGLKALEADLTGKPLEQAKPVEPVEPGAPAESAPTAIDAIAKLSTLGDVDLLSMYAETLTVEIRQDERFAKAFKARLAELKEPVTAK